MNTTEQIQHYIDAQEPSKSTDMQAIHTHILGLQQNCKLWFLDGKNEVGKVVANPNIGYGLQTMHYADGRSQPFYQIGLSANSKGISIYILGLKDKSFLKNTYASTIGKANVTGYCIQFKKLADLQSDVLYAAIQEGFRQTAQL